MPPFPLSRISFGPVGQSLEITNLFKTTASRITFGRPSYLELRINKSLDLINGYGFFLKSNIFTIFSKEFFSIYFSSSIFFSPCPIISNSIFYFFFSKFIDFNRVKWSF